MYFSTEERLLLVSSGASPDLDAESSGDFRGRIQFHLGRCLYVPESNSVPTLWAHTCPEEVVELLLVYTSLH